MITTRGFLAVFLFLLSLPLAADIAQQDAKFAKLPAAESYAMAIFPTLDEQSAAKAVVAETWANEMGVQ